MVNSQSWFNWPSTVLQFLQCMLHRKKNILSRSAGVATAKRSRLDTIVTSSTMFVKENEEILRKHYKVVVIRAIGPLLAPLYLLADVEESKEDIDVRQDLSKLKF